jgi:hypothetical protein
MKRQVLKVWSKASPPTSSHLPADSTAESLPVVPFRRARFVIETARVEFISSNCVCNQRDLEALETTLKMQTLSRQYKLHFIFYVEWVKEDENMKDAGRVAGKGGVDDHSAMEESNALVDAEENSETVEGNVHAAESD